MEVPKGTCHYNVSNWEKVIMEKNVPPNPDTLKVTSMYISCAWDIRTKKQG